jgi:hypothetical protein
LGAVRRKPSEIKVENELVLVKANNTGRWHKFDLDMLPKLQGRAWRENGTGELVTSGKETTITASHLVVGKPKKGMLVNHKDHDRTNNLYDNLHHGTYSQSNVGWSRRTSSSGYRGVWWSSSHKKWTARVTVEGRRINLGYHDDPAEMAKVYDEAALKHFGEFAVTNKMLGYLKEVEPPGIVPGEPPV